MAATLTALASQLRPKQVTILLRADQYDADTVSVATTKHTGALLVELGLVTLVEAYGQHWSVRITDKGRTLAEHIAPGNRD